MPLKTTHISKVAVIYAIAVNFLTFLLVNMLTISSFHVGTAEGTAVCHSTHAILRCYHPIAYLALGIWLLIFSNYFKHCPLAHLLLQYRPVSMGLCRFSS